MFYAVKKGHTIGVFDNWPEAQAATIGFSSPEFRKFKTKEEAEAYLSDRDIWIERVAEDGKKGYLVAFTDGSFDQELKRYSYGVSFILPDGTEKVICGYGSNPDYIDSNNIIGEIFGVINAIDWAISNGYEKIKIYHDYEGISKWLSGEWSANKKVSQMLVGVYKAKFEGVIQTEFEKVPGHSNVIYNEKADQIAKAALVDGKKVAIQGENWFSLPYFNYDDLEAFSQIIEETDENISHTVDNKTDRVIYRFKLNSDFVTVTLFTSGKHKLLAQGKNTYLFQVIVTTVVELYGDSNVEQILGSAYRVSVKKDIINNAYRPVELGLPMNYPMGNKRLIKQAIINLNYFVESEDYSQYVFPALKALEGHIKYLFAESGKMLGRRFDCFNLDKTVVPPKYVVTANLSDRSKIPYIEECYNYYKNQRDTIFHCGDIIGTVDNTRFINTKEEADEIIQKCIELISRQQ